MVGLGSNLNLVRIAKIIHRWSGATRAASPSRSYPIIRILHIFLFPVPGRNNLHETVGAAEQSNHDQHQVEDDLQDSARTRGFIFAGGEVFQDAALLDLHLQQGFLVVSKKD